MNKEQAAHFLQEFKNIEALQDEATAKEQQWSKELIKLAKELPWTISNCGDYSIKYTATLDEDWEAILVLSNACFRVANGYIELLVSRADICTLRVVSTDGSVKNWIENVREYVPDIPLPDYKFAEIQNLQAQIASCQERLKELGAE